MPTAFTTEQINALAAELKLEPAAVQAVCVVESAGDGKAGASPGSLKTSSSLTFSGHSSKNNVHHVILPHDTILEVAEALSIITYNYLSFLPPLHMLQLHIDGLYIHR